MTGKIFISYARDDEQKVRQIYDELKSAGYAPWLDVESILPGENWKRSINKAIEDADIFLAILSERSVNKRGIIQKEIRLALDKMEELLPGDLFIIPLRLDNCDIPERLEHLHMLDWNGGKGLDKLFAAVDKGLEKRAAESERKTEREAAGAAADQAVKMGKTIKGKFARFVKKNGGIVAVIVAIVTILGVLLQVADSPAVQAIFRSPTSTYTATPTATVPPTLTDTPTPELTATSTPDSVPSSTLTLTVSATLSPTSRFTPSPTPTHAVTLPDISSADCVPQNALRQEAYVLEAIDAEKIKVRIDGDINLVEYLGVDAPVREAYFGIYSYYENIELVVGQWVTLVSDPNIQELGEYLDRYVFVDDTFVNYELIRQGFAQSETYSSAYACVDAFQHAQRQAELSPVGLWKPTNTPWPSPAPGEPPCNCRSDTRNCDTFRTQSEAQKCFEYCQGLGYGDVHNLDTDGDNWACEN